MEIKESSAFNYQNKSLMKFGYLSSIFLAIITFITFVLAMIAVPISGANAPNGGILYPYLNTLQQYPRDYIWQYAALLLIIVYLGQYSIIHSSVNEKNKMFSQIGLLFALLSSIDLLITYYTQVSIVPVSLLNKETEGIALFTQYNPHGFFIALEELGYLLMILSFMVIIPIFNDKGKLTFSIKIIYTIACATVLMSLILICAKYGLDKKDRFEEVIISVAWLVLIINSILISIMFRKNLKM